MEACNSVSTPSRLGILVIHRSQNPGSTRRDRIGAQSISSAVWPARLDILNKVPQRRNTNSCKDPFRTFF